MNLIFNSEKKIGLFILTSAVIVAGILAFYDPQASKKSLADLQKEGGADAEGFNIEKDGQKLGVISGEDLSALLTGEKPAENLTQKFADNLAKGFIDSNPSGIQNGQEITVPDSQTLLEQISTEQSKSIDKSLFVTKKDLKISSDNSQGNIYDYYTNYQEVINKYSGKISLVDSFEMFVNTNNPEYFKQPLIYTEGIIKDLKNVVVPSDFYQLHLDTINLFIMNQNILESLVNINNDPLKAASASMIIEEIMKKSVILTDDFASALEAHGFQIKK